MATRQRWTPAQVKMLLEMVESDDQPKWRAIAARVGHSVMSCRCKYIAVARQRNDDDEQHDREMWGGVREF